MTSDFLCVPLGGVGEFGCNLTLYAYDDRWLAIDCGMGFADGEIPGVDITLPNPAYLVERRDRLEAIVLTHAHEDHIGAVAHLWPQLQCPVYGTAFVLELMKRKLAEKGLVDKVPLREFAPGGSLTLGPFGITFVTVTHSTLEPNLLLIETEAGRVVHSGDWKLDPDPVVGEVTDIDALKRIGEGGVDVLIGDSTNAMTPGRSVSEAAVQEALTAEFGKHGQRIAVCCFASNIARLESIARAAQAHGRHVALVGRSLYRLSDAARACGYLDDIPEFIDDRDAGLIPRDKIVLVCTGSQGEPRAAMPRIADNTHRHIKLDPGDAVMFSSRAIPGNEREILRMQNRLIAQGINVVTDHEAPIHASGHPAQDELRDMFGWLKPKALIPVHGETAHLHAHAALARECGIAAPLIPENGSVIRLNNGDVREIDRVETGKLAIDGSQVIAADSDLIRTRLRIAETGSAVITLVMDKKGRLLATPQVSSPALFDQTEEDDDRLAAIEDAVQMAIEALPSAELRSDGAVESAASRALRRETFEMLGRKPLTEIHLVRV